MPAFKSRPIEKVDNRGRVIERYPSIKVAAEKSYMSTATMRKHCEGKMPYSYDEDGYAYRFAKDE